METTHYASNTNKEGEYIPKSYRFERDMDTSNLKKRYDFLQFDDEANEHIVYQDIQELIDKPSELAKLVNYFVTHQKVRLEILEDYSRGENYTILNGRKRLEEDKADYRIRHDLAGKASRFFTGYSVGKPITITDSEGADVFSVYDFNNYNDIESLDRELVYDASRFGRAFELHYRDSENTNAVVLVDAKEMFTIRSADVKHEIIGAVHCPVYNNQMFVSLYTNNHIYKYQPTDTSSIALVKDGEGISHDYGMVPIVEWQNNRERFGDWEKAIPLIDAYDAAESDTANYMSDLNDALLVIKGDLEASGLTPTDAEKMKRANMLVLESGMTVSGTQTSVDAGYIYKQYDVTGTEAYKTRLLRDFYSNIGLIDVQNDSSFSASSGIAIRYKLVDLEQVATFKKGFFIKALRRRFRILENINKALNNEVVSADDLVFTFHENLPTDIWAEIQSYINAGGEISQETLMENASFTDSVKEKKRLLDDTVPNTASDEERSFLTSDNTDTIGGDTVDGNEQQAVQQ